MGNVSTSEDIDQRRLDDAENVRQALHALTSIKHLPDGLDARHPRLRDEVKQLWRAFEDALEALRVCLARTWPNGKHGKIDQAISASRLNNELHKALSQLVAAYPHGHDIRVALERGLKAFERR